MAANIGIVVRYVSILKQQSYPFGLLKSIEAHISCPETWRFGSTCDLYQAWKKPSFVSHEARNQPTGRTHETNRSAVSDQETPLRC